MNSKAKKTIRIVVNVILWIFMIFAILTTVFSIAAQSNDGVPTLGGKCFMTVQSDSMKPTFKEGDLLICKKLGDKEKRNLEKDDIISFYSDLDGNGVNEINTHRIYSVNKDANGDAISYITKGDNEKTNSTVDSVPVLVSSIISKWEGNKVSGMGSFISFLQKPTAFLCVVVLPLVLFFAYELYSFIKQAVAIKNAGKKQITAADEELIKQRAVEEYIRQQQVAASVENNSDPKTDDQADKTKVK